MLKPIYRLKKRSAFAATYHTGHTIHKDGITVFCGRNKTDNFTTKIGFVISKKISKRAVKRNRIKRLMRESCRLYIKNNDFNPKYMSLIFVASSKLIDKNFEEINSAVSKLMEKIKND